MHFVSVTSLGSYIGSATTTVIEAGTEVSTVMAKVGGAVYSGKVYAAFAVEVRGAPRRGLTDKRVCPLALGFEFLWSRCLA